MHPQSRRAEEAVNTLKAAAKRHGIEVVHANEMPVESGDAPCDMVVSIGGDGTLLAAARQAYPAHLPAWGINVGRLGFLTTSGTDEIEAGIERIARGDYTVEQRALLEAKVTGGMAGEMDLVALNDIVLHRRSAAGLLTLDCELNGRFLQTYESDGLVVATPTGSTAYSLAAGGSILSPTLKAFIITPICPHSLSARSLVVDDSSVVVIKPRFEHPEDVITVTADGQTHSQLHAQRCTPKSGGDAGYAVTIRRAEENAGLVRFDEVIFSDVLRDKLGWAGGAPLR